MSLDSLSEIAGTYLTIRSGQISLAPAETLIVALGLAAALLSGFHLWRFGRREDRQIRLKGLTGAALDPADMARTRAAPWYRRLGGIVAASPMVGAGEQQRLLDTLAAAGIKGHGNLASFVASKVCGAVAVPALLWLLLQWRQWFAGATTIRLGVLLAALMLGWRLPDIILSRLAARRRLRLEQGIPDALDLLVICAEAGLSLNQAIEEVSRDIRPSNPDVADEFAVTAAEMRVLSDVGQAIDNMAERTGLASLRSMIATLKQSMKFGTPLAESMRMLAADMRATRLARIEERAARLPVLLSIPMALFILPCLMMVIGTPLVLRIGDIFAAGAP
jgi:tight adherence protein C